MLFREEVKENFQQFVHRLAKRCRLFLAIFIRIRQYCIMIYTYNNHDYGDNQHDKHPRFSHSIVFNECTGEIN